MYEYSYNIGDVIYNIWKDKFYIVVDFEYKNTSIYYTIRDVLSDNIIVNDRDFKLIDWRQSFGQSVQFGDIYYDISKLNHSLFINHEIVNKNLFVIEEHKKKVECGILRKDVHTLMEKNLDSFVLAQNLSLLKVKALTAIIWINMSPLHHHFELSGFSEEKTVTLAFVVTVVTSLIAYYIMVGVI